VEGVCLFGSGQWTQQGLGTGNTPCGGDWLQRLQIKHQSKSRKVRLLSCVSPRETGLFRTCLEHSWNGQEHSKKDIYVITVERVAVIGSLYGCRRWACHLADCFLVKFFKVQGVIVTTCLKLYSLQR